MSTDKPTHQPDDLGDLPLQPTGSGVADLDIDRLQSAVADASVNAGIADEAAPYDKGLRPIDEDDGPTKTQA